jgi:hypothetical protein
LKKELNDLGENADKLLRRSVERLEKSYPH